MIRDILRSAFGGPNTITRWTLIVVFPLGLLAGTLWGIRMGIAVVPWLLTVTFVQTLLLIPIWFMRMFLKRINAQRPHPWWGFWSLGLIGALRTGLILACGNLFDVPISLEYIAGYMPYGIATGVVFMGVAAVVVDRNREHRLIMQNLAHMDAAITRAREFDEAEFEGIEQRVVAEIGQTIARELETLTETSTLSPAGTAQALREIAADVVRPLSHRIVDEAPWLPAEMSIDNEPTATFSRRDRRRALLGDLRPAPPLIPFILIQLIAQTDAAASRFGGFIFASVNMLFGGTVMFVLSWLLIRWWPLGRTTVMRLALMIAAYAGIGAFAAWLMSVTYKYFVGVDQTLWVASAMLVVTSVGLSFLITVENQRQILQDSLSESVVRNSQLTLQLRERSRYAQRRIAKFLHSNVQAELVAAAITLSRESNAVQSAAEIERLNIVIGKQFEPHDHPNISARDRIDDLISLWSSVLTVHSEVHESVWTALDANSQALTSVDEVLSEGLTNAVRHGNGPLVEVSMQCDQNELRITLTSTGTIAVGGVPGLGSRFLTESTREWSLIEDGDHIQFTAIIQLSNPNL